jgi:hypothetical protein
LLATVVLSVDLLTGRSLAKDGGWDFEACHVQITVAIDAPGGIADQLAGDLPRYLQQRIQASLTPVWSSDVHVATGPDRPVVFVSMATPEAPPPKLPADKDKLLLATVRWAPDAFELQAREFDRYVRRWSVPIRRESRQVAALPEQLFALIWQACSPIVQLEPDPKDAYRMVLKPRGAWLPRPAGAPPWAKPGDVFLPVLRRTTRSGELEKKDGIQYVPWTYLEVTDVKSGAIAARILRASRRPFAAKRLGRVEQVAIALRADPDATTLRLHSRTAAAKPLVNYEVFSQNPGDEAATRIGLSDTAGQIVVAPGKQRVQFVLVKHGGQLFARVPIAAGAQSLVQVPLPDDDARLAAEAQLAALREELIDVVARRNILMSRARQKIQTKDFDAAQELLRALDDLPGRPQFNVTLTTAARTLRSDDPQMQRRIDQLFDATRSLLTQYLDLRPISQLHDELRQAQQKGDSKSSPPRSANKT